jgi:predicted secreted Zn-dependent protease
MSKPPQVQIDMSEDMVEAVMREWELEHPGRTAREMTSGEFADRMMEKVVASAKFVPGTKPN